jgi:hypothetical protein
MSRNGLPPKSWKPRALKMQSGLEEVLEERLEPTPFLVFSKRRRRFAGEIWRETAETRSLFGADGEREQIDSSADKLVIENDWVNWKSIVLNTEITPARAVSD